MFQDSGEVAVLCTFIGCMTALVWRAISLPVAIERQKQRTERQENRTDLRGEKHADRMDMREAKFEGRQDTKQERIEAKSQ